MSAEECVDERKKAKVMSFTCQLCRRDFKNSTVLRAHAMKDHARAYSSQSGKTTDFSGEYRVPSNVELEWARATLGHRNAGKGGGKQTPYTPRPSRFSPLGSGAGMVSPTHSLKSGYGSCRSVSMTLAPDEVTNRMLTEMASLRRHASTSSSDSGGQRKDKDRRAASSSVFKSPRKEATPGVTKEAAEQRERQSRVRREVAMKTLRNSPWNEKEQYIRQKANYIGSQLFAVTAEVGRELAAGNRWEEDSDFDDLRPSASEVERSGRERATGGDPFQSGSVGQLETSSVDTSATTVALISPLGEDNGAGSGQQNAGERANSESIIGDNTVVRSTETREAQSVTKQRHSLDDADMSSFESMRDGWRAEKMDEIVEFVVHHEPPWNVFAMTDELKLGGSFDDEEPGWLLCNITQSVLLLKDLLMANHAEITGGKPTAGTEYFLHPKLSRAILQSSITRIGQWQVPSELSQHPPFPSSPKGDGRDPQSRTLDDLESNSSRGSSAGALAMMTYGGGSAQRNIDEGSKMAVGRWSLRALADINGYLLSSTPPWNPFDVAESLIKEKYFGEMNREWLQCVLTQSTKLLKALLQHSSMLMDSQTPSRADRYAFHSRFRNAIHSATVSRVGNRATQRRGVLNFSLG